MKSVKVTSLTRWGILLIALLTGSAFATPIVIINGDFETGSDNDSPAGWTDTSSSSSFWLGVADETGNPTATEASLAPGDGLGDYFLTTARQSAGVDSQPTDAQLIQVVDLSAFASDIDTGNQTLNVDFVYASDDARDTGSFTLYFYSSADGSGTALSSYTVSLDAGSGYDFTGWLEMTVGGVVPVTARSVTLQIDTTRTGGSETNIWIDNISGSIVPEPATMVLLGLGGLILRHRK